MYAPIKARKTNDVFVAKFIKDHSDVKKLYYCVLHYISTKCHIKINNSKSG